MRQIKFRGRFEFSGEDERFATWLYGCLLLEKDGGVYILPEGHTSVRMGDVCIDGGPETGCYMPAVLPDTVGQFTGLTDKNGREIYEGDVIESNLIRHVVEYKPSDAMFVGRSLDIKDLATGQFVETTLSDHWIEGWGKEVIGNIHDNPELLNAKV